MLQLTCILNLLEDVVHALLFVVEILRLRRYRCRLLLLVLTLVLAAAIHVPAEVATVRQGVEVQTLKRIDNSGRLKKMW